MDGFPLEMQEDSEDSWMVEVCLVEALEGTSYLGTMVVLATLELPLSLLLCPG